MMPDGGEPHYATNPYGQTPRGGRRGFLGLALAVIGIIAFAGAILLVYARGGHSSSDGGPPLLTAESTPFKVRPDQPGGFEVPHQDKLVYERLSERGAKPTVEHLLPPPEEPLPLPVVAPQVPKPPPLPQMPAVGQFPPPPPGSTTTEPRPADTPPAEAPAPPPSVAMAPAPEPAPMPSSKPAPVAPAAKASPPPPVPQPRPAPQSQQQPQSVPKVAAAPPPPAPPSAPKAEPPAKAVSSGAANWRVQLASLRSEAEASAEWKRLAGRYADVLGGLSPKIVKADLGEKGVYYRVQGVGLDEARAKTVCAQLKAQNVGCVLVRP